MSVGGPVTGKTSGCKILGFLKDIFHISFMALKIKTLHTQPIPLFLGSIYDALQSYDWCFYFAGVSSGAAGLLFLISLLAMRKIKCFS